MEVFGEDNFIATVIWHKMDSPKNTAKHFSVRITTMLVVYARNGENCGRPNPLPRSEAQDAVNRYKNPDGRSLVDRGS